MSKNTEKLYCGSVFVATNYLLMLQCKFCPRQFIPYEKFRKHIFEKHFDDIDQYKNENFEDDDLNEMLKRNRNHKDFVQELHTDDAVNTKNTNQEAVIPVVHSLDISITKERKNSNASEAAQTKQHQSASNSSNQVSIVRSELRKTFARYRKAKERNLKCKVCDFATNCESNLKTHELRHTNNKPFPCTLCTKAFFTSTELNTHTRWHTGERPYICPYCGKDFVTNGALNLHEHRHRNERRFKCDQCDKSYFSGSLLRQHISKHTGERNYKCKQCPQTFTRPGSLRNHMKLHENALRHECNICHKRFNQKPTLLWHKKSQHDIIIDADAGVEPEGIVNNESPAEANETVTCMEIEEQQLFTNENQFTENIESIEIFTTIEEAQGKIIGEFLVI